MQNLGSVLKQYRHAVQSVGLTLPSLPSAERRDPPLLIIIMPPVLPLRCEHACILLILFLEQESKDCLNQRPFI